MSVVDPAATDIESLVGYVHEQVGRRAGTYFPELMTDSPQVSVSSVAARPRAVNVSLVVRGQVVRRIFVKLARVAPERDVLNLRPRLTTDSDPAQMAALEHAALVALHHRMCAEQPPRLGAVRPLDHLEEVAGIAMAYVPEPTLRDVLTERWKVGLPRLGGSNLADGLGRAFHDAGRWLSVYHSLDLPVARRVLYSTRDEVGGALRGYGAYVGERVGRGPSVGELSERLARRARRLLPVVLDVAHEHGDFTMRNLFVGEGGRITGFDCRPLSLLPIHQDVARFVVTLRTTGIQMATGGRGVARSQLRRLEDAFLSGYGREGEGFRSELAVFEGLVLLDRWASFLANPQWNQGARAVARRWFDRVLRRELERIVASLG